MYVAHSHNISNAIDILCLDDRAFPVAGPRLWNILSSNLRPSDLTLQQFRRSLKTYLFG